MEEYSPEKIVELENKVRSLPQRIIEVQEAERHRIAKEIHDDLGQSLAALKMLIQSSVLPEYITDASNRRAYQRVVDYIDEIIEKTRDIATALRPKIIETMGLTRAIKKMLAGFRKNKGLHIKAQVGNLNDIKFESSSINLYRIVQEALANLYHHAEATSVEVLFRRGKQSLTMTIKDNGKGFFPHKASKGTGHASKHGLSTMYERARLLGGELEIESEPGKGTLIRLHIPISIKE
ncbi:MAG: sensor histidine kinase [Candidatus Omnitrophota bacterium]